MYHWSGGCCQVNWQSQGLKHCWSNTPNKQSVLANLLFLNALSQEIHSFHKRHNWDQEQEEKNYRTISRSKGKTNLLLSKDERSVFKSNLTGMMSSVNWVYRQSSRYETRVREKNFIQRLRKSFSFIITFKSSRSPDRTYEFKNPYFIWGYQVLQFHSVHIRKSHFPHPTYALKNPYKPCSGQAIPHVYKICNTKLLHTIQKPNLRTFYCVWRQ